MAEEAKKVVRVTAGDIQQALNLGYPLTCVRLCESCKETKHPDQFPSKRSTCKSCRRAAYKARKSERLAAGKCVYCGEHPLLTESRCEQCNQKHKANNNKRRTARKNGGSVSYLW